MTKRKKPNKLKRYETVMYIANASDFPHAPGLLALMWAGEIYIEKKYDLSKDAGYGKE